MLNRTGAQAESTGVINELKYSGGKEKNHKGGEMTYYSRSSRRLYRWSILLKRQAKHIHSA